jgi:hypothetical protein
MGTRTKYFADRLGRIGPKSTPRRKPVPTRVLS